MIGKRGNGGEREEVVESMVITDGVEGEVEKEMSEVVKENLRIGPSLLEEMKSWRRNCLEVDEDLVGSTLTDTRTSQSKQLVQMSQQP